VSLDLLVSIGALVVVLIVLGALLLKKE